MQAAGGVDIVVAQERVGFRPPLTTILPVAVVLVLLGLIFPSDGTWGFVVVFLTVLPNK